MKVWASKFNTSSYIRDPSATFPVQFQSRVLACVVAWRSEEHADVLNAIRDAAMDFETTKCCNNRQLPKWQKDLGPLLLSYQEGREKALLHWAAIHKASSASCHLGSVRQT